ncbi:unnamed protein product [Withania somnifera]
MLIRRMGCFSPSLSNKTSPFFSLFTKTPYLFHLYPIQFQFLFLKPIHTKKLPHTHPFSMNPKKTHSTTSAAFLQEPTKTSSNSVLRHKLDQCSKHGDLQEALRLYEEAKLNNVTFNVHHFNVLLYLCSTNEEDGVGKGFEIFKQMGENGVVPNEATFTSVARLAVAKQDPEMAFDLMKKMKSFGVPPKLRSYGPALFGFCEKGMADKAYEVDVHMRESGVAAEEAELCALLKVSSSSKRGDKVYEMLHRIRASVRQVSEETASVIEDWFKSALAEEVGVKNWDVGKVKEGWLGKGKWNVVRAEIDSSGVCRSCGEKLVCIDIDPKETENFANSLAKLACEREVKANFVQFQDWLQKHGPFDAVVDGANVGLISERNFNFSQLRSVVNKLRQMSESKKLPLVILHKSRTTGGPAQHPNNKKLLESWKKAGALYATPHGSNDDWYWLYAAVSSKCLLLTNDEMRDHLFQLLGTSFFPRWKEKHQIRMTASKDDGLKLHMPPPYSIVIQESEQGCWHVPTLTGDDLEIPRQWICATRRKALHSVFRRTGESNH